VGIEGRRLVVARGGLNPVSRIRVAALLLLLLAGGLRPANIPSSPRSREAIDRVKPRLTTALRERGLAYGSPIFLRIFKEEDELEIWVERNGKYERFHFYKICNYSGDLGPKLREGDNQSPEGFYTVGPAQLNPLSNFHLSFNLGYPNEFDRANGRTGSALMVHGSCVSIGCYAMTDRAIEEIYAMADGALRGGQPRFAVHIFPFRPTTANMRRHSGSRWSAFWNDLKRGHDVFEQHRRPPRVTVRNRRYVVLGPS
jgi:murein L,D-transpeptidase YafK